MPNDTYPPSPWQTCQSYRDYFPTGDRGSFSQREQAEAILAAMLRRVSLPDQITDEIHKAAIEAGKLPDDDEDSNQRAFTLLSEAAQGFRLMIATDWSEPPATHQWLVEGWLSHGRIALLAGKGGLGKSKLALQLATAVATGAEVWFPGGPEVTRHGRVVFATWEDDRDEIARRLLYNPEVRGKGHAAQTLGKLLGDCLHVVDMAGNGPMWQPAHGGARTGDGAGEPSHAGAALRDHCKDVGATLLIVDPVAAAFGLNENNRGAVREFLSSWDRWGRDAGCTVLFIAHPPKTDATYSGSTDWQAAPRSVLIMEREDKNDDNSPPILTAEKVSYGKRPASYTLDNWHWWRAVADVAKDECPELGEL